MATKEQVFAELADRFKLKDKVRDQILASGVATLSGSLRKMTLTLSSPRIPATTVSTAVRWCSALVVSAVRQSTVARTAVSRRGRS